jgi:hypothetical protein
MQEKRIATLKEMGRYDDAEKLEKGLELLKESAVPTPARESVPEDAQGGALSAGRPSNPVLTSAPWGTDQIIYQGDVTYNIWAPVEVHQPFSVDYDSLGNIYAAVSMASDSSIHLFQSTDNGVTWVDQYNFMPSPPAHNTNLQLVVSDDGDSAFAYIFYLYTGGQGGNLWNHVTNISTWTMARQALLDNAAADTITDFSVTRDHYFGDLYYVYVDYQEHPNNENPGIFFTWTDDHGNSWSPPTQLQFQSSDPSLAYGGYSVDGNLYRAYTFLADSTDSRINVRRSTNFGTSWQSSQTIRDGSLGDHADPQVAAAHVAPANQMVWVLNTTNFQNSGNLQVWANYSSDGGATWNSPNGPSFDANALEYASSINLLRSDGNDFFVISYIYDDTATTILDSVRVQMTDSTGWPGPSASVGINDSLYAFNIRPLVTYSSGLPGVAYSGVAGVNVYYDNVWFTGVEESEIDIRSSRFELRQNRPNPFTSGTIIQYSLPVKGEISLKVYDVTGRLVRTLVKENQDSGVYSVTWDGKNDSGNRVSAGIYFSRLSGKPGVLTKKLTLIH